MVGTKFQVPCSIIATSRPASGASARAQRLAERAAMPMPMPVMAVNSGWANAEKMTRTRKVANSSCRPVLTPYSLAPAA
jgi:hypothetical protein